MLSLRLDILVMFLEFLEKVKQLILLLDDVGRQRVNSTKIEAE
jgi:hypothetical protein